MRLIPVVALALSVLSVGAPARAQAAPPAPTFLLYPDPAFDPDRQCRGELAVEEVRQWLRRARLALHLPGTVAVALDEGRGCLRVTVESVGTGRLAELLLRGVAVPRRAVLLELIRPVG